MTGAQNLILLGRKDQKHFLAAERGPRAFPFDFLWNGMAWFFFTSDRLWVSLAASGDCVLGDLEGKKV